MNQCHSFDNQLVMISIEEAFEGALKESPSLQALCSANRSIVLDVVRHIDIYQIRKSVSDTKVHFNKIRNRYGNTYIQARGAVPVGKGRRKWVGCYLGKEKDIIDPSTGKPSDYWLIKGNEMVKNKLLDQIVNW